MAKFHGVGPKTATKMRALGIEKGADLRRHSLDFLQHNFGKAESWYHNIARGRDDRLVQSSALEDLTTRVDRSAGNFSTNSFFAENSRWLRQMASWRRESSGADPP
jgi:nucleotidyltransferase/DNA polymerase involved in DNA repair